MLTFLRLEDWKSFADQRIELAPLTLLVGPNASGKSNFLDAIRYLQGLALGMSPDEVLRGRTEGGRIVWPGIRGGPAEAVRQGAQSFKIESGWAVGEGEGVAGNLFIHVIQDNPVGKRGWSAALIDAMRSTLFLEIMPSRMRDYVPRSATNLGVNGENISAVLYQLCQDSEKKQDLIDWLSELCAPELADIDFIETGLGDVMLVLVEKGGNRLSARSLSDGTLRFLGELVAMLTAPPGSLLIMEEIENGLHPARANLLVQEMESATRPGRCQVLATTHSPLILQALSPERLGEAIVFGRPPEAPGTVMKRLKDLPHFQEIVERRGIEHLFTTKWLERAL